MVDWRPSRQHPRSSALKWACWLEVRAERRRLMRRVIFALLSLAALFAASVARADTFGSGASQFSIDFVMIGNPGNPADTTGYPIPAGSVPYVYQIGTYEISEQMIDKANALGGLGITKDTRGPDRPATSISWLE